MNNTNEQPKTGLRKWMPLLVMSLALMIIILDTTILNVSLRAIIGDLHTTIQNIQWVITIYSLMLAAFTTTGGRLGDIFGRKKMFVWGAIIFAIGSFITSISNSVGVMISGESIIEGIGAAIMLPATASLLVSNYRGRDRAVAFGIWGGVAAAAAALGPVVGGWITTNYTWRWAFRINVGVAILLVIGSMIVQEARETEEKPTIDYFGIVLSALGLLSIVFGMIEAETYGWFHALRPFSLFGGAIQFVHYSPVPGFIALGIVILIFFFAWERRMMRRGQTPLVSLALFSNTQFITGASITGVLSLAQTGLLFSVPIFFQAVRGFDPLQTGIAMLPMSLAILVAAPLSSYLSKFISPKKLIQAGLLLDAAGFLLLRQEFQPGASAWALVPGFLVFGAGLGLMISQSNNVTLSAVSVQEAGEASGVNNTLRQVGSTFGAAILGSILLTALAANLSTGILNSATIPQTLKTQVAAAASAQTSNVEFGGGIMLQGSNLPAPVQDEIRTVSERATVDANKTMLGYGVIFVLLGFLISFKLPGGKNIETERSVAVT